MKHAPHEMIALSDPPCETTLPIGPAQGAPGAGTDLGHEAHG